MVLSKVTTFETQLHVQGTTMSSADVAQSREKIPKKKKRVNFIEYP